MRKYIITLLAACLTAIAAMGQEKPDTIAVSDLYTTHLMFDTDIIYADLSNGQILLARVVEQSKDVIALKARMPFFSTLSVSAKESNGRLHTYIIRYQEQPSTLIYDERSEARSPKAEPADSVKTARRAPGKKVNARKEDAPLLRDVTQAPQGLWHVSSRQYDITASCINILSYSDITYLVFSLENQSGVSYEFKDAVFVIESRRRTRKSVVYDNTVFHKSRHGGTSCAPGQKTVVGYTLDKMTLSRDQVLRVYFYEQGGQRQLSLTIDYQDINKARNTIRQR